MSEIILKEGSTPSTPAAGQVSLYAKDDANIYKQGEFGVERVLTSGRIIDTLFYVKVPVGQTSTFDVTNIPSGYDFIELIVNGVTNIASGVDNLIFEFNGDTNVAHYSRGWLFTDGTNFTSPINTADNRFGSIGGINQSNTVGQVVSVLGNPNSNLHKIITSKCFVLFPAPRIYEIHGAWKSTASITRITIKPVGGTAFAAGTLLVATGYKLGV